MGKEASYHLFDESTSLIRAGRYREALQILNQLNEAHPNTRNVIYSAALCLEKLGRSQKALPLCDELIEKFDDPRAREMKVRLERAQPPSLPPAPPASLNHASDYGYEGIQGLYAPPTRAPLQPSAHRDWKLILIWAGLLLLLLSATIGLWLWQESPSLPRGEHSGTSLATPGKMLPRPLRPSPYTVPSRILFTLVSGVMVGTIAGYGALKAMSKLEKHNLMTNVVHIGVTMLILQLIRIIARIIQLGITAPDLTLLTSVGAIALSGYVLARAFKLSLGSFLVFLFLYGVFAVILVLPIAIVFGRYFQDLLFR